MTTIVSYELVYSRATLKVRMKKKRDYSEKEHLTPSSAKEDINNNKLIIIIIFFKSIVVTVQIYTFGVIVVEGGVNLPLCDILGHLIA